MFHQIWAIIFISKQIWSSILQVIFGHQNSHYAHMLQIYLKFRLGKKFGGRVPSRSTLLGAFGKQCKSKLLF